jgi:hypothetical protein
MKLHEHELCIILGVPVGEEKCGAVLQKIWKEHQHLFPCFFHNLL